MALWRQGMKMLLSLFLSSLLVFFSFYALPGDPLDLMLGTEASEEKREALAAALHLDQGPMESYRRSVFGLFSQKDPVMSIRFQQPVRSLMLGRLGLSLRLAFLAFAMVLALALPLAILAVRRPQGRLDRFISGLSQFLMAIPSFFMGMLLILLFGFVFKLYRLGAYQALSSGLLAHLRSLLVPALALALPLLFRALQFLRSALLETAEADYVRTARSKGAGFWRILWVHRLRNSFLAFVTTLGVILAELITGSFLVEQIFVLPGLGRLLFTAIEARDLPLAQGIILSLAGLVILINGLADQLNAWIDPRLKKQALPHKRWELHDA